MVNSSGVSIMSFGHFTEKKEESSVVSAGSAQIMPLVSYGTENIAAQINNLLKSNDYKIETLPSTLISSANQSDLQQLFDLYPECAAHLLKHNKIPASSCSQMGLTAFVFALRIAPDFVYQHIINNSNTSILDSIINHILNKDGRNTSQPSFFNANPIKVSTELRSMQRENLLENSLAIFIKEAILHQSPWNCNVLTRSNYMTIVDQLFLKTGSLAYIFERMKNEQAEYVSQLHYNLLYFLFKDSNATEKRTVYKKNHTEEKDTRLYETISHIIKENTYYCEDDEEAERKHEQWTHLLFNFFTIGGRGYEESPETSFYNPKNIFLLNKKLTSLALSTDTSSVPFPFQNIAFITHVFGDGVGDLIHCLETAKLFKKYFPLAKIQNIIFLDDYQARAGKNQGPLLLIENNSGGIPYTLYDSGIAKEDKFVLSQDRFDCLAQKLKDDKVEAVFEISFRTLDLLSELKKRDYEPLYYTFWSEMSSTFLGTNPQFSLVTEKDTREKTIHSSSIGSGLGIRFEPSLMESKQEKGPLTESQINLFESDALKKILLDSHGKKNSFLYKGYLRTDENLLAFCYLLRCFHNIFGSDIVNVYVKKIPTASQLQWLYIHNSYSQIYLATKDGETYCTQNTTGYVPTSPPTVMLRLICLPISYSDSNHLTSLSQFGACCGDSTFFECLSLQNLFFMEKMNYDHTMYRYLIYLCDQYTSNAELGNFFREIFCLTSMISSEPQLFYDSGLDNYLSNIAKLLTGEKFAFLTSEYQKLREKLIENHNFENNIKHFNRWYNKDLWRPDEANKTEYTASYVGFWATRPAPALTDKSATSTPNPNPQLLSRTV